MSSDHRSPGAIGGFVAGAPSWKLVGTSVLGTDHSPTRTRSLDTVAMGCDKNAFVFVLDDKSGDLFHEVQ